MNKIKAGQLYKDKYNDGWTYILSVNETLAKGKSYDALIDALKGTPHEGNITLDSLSCNVRAFSIKDIDDKILFNKSCTSQFFPDLFILVGELGVNFTIKNDTIVGFNSFDTAFTTKGK